MATPSSSAASDAGHTIGPYTLTREIGKGSFAVVFLGKNRSPETSSNTENGTTKVAIKIVTRKKLTAKLLENLEGEINILRTVRHANIVELIDCLKTSSHIYLIMEYCKMGDLSMYIRSRRRNSSKDGDRRISLFEAQADAQYPHPPDGGLNADVTRSFLSQLASALQFMRDKNIVHRDIKPQNLLLQEPEADLVASGHPTLIPQIKVADFGFARHLDVASLAETLCGSPLYMAPEILKHQKYDAKTDLWSVGAVLYEMCVGRPPFRAANHIELLKRIERAEDKIKFPDEKSEDSLRREQMRRTEGCRDGEEVLRPHTVDGDLKALIRTLLKQKPVERMSFESFFACSITESTRTHSMKSSAASLSNSSTPVATRPAPAIPTSVQTNNNDDTRRTSRASPEGAPATSRNHFKSKYVVGGRQVTPRTPRREREEANKGTSRDEHVGEAGEASSLEDNVLETPGSSVTNLPATAVPGPTLVTAIGTKSAASPTRGQAQRATVLDEDDKGYVMVEKKSVEVNSLADEMADANLAKTANEQRGPWGALGRRPSRLSRLASGLGAATVKAVAAGPSSPSTSPSSPQQSPSTQRSNALFEIGVDARHAAPFAIPSSARRPSFNRRRSQASDQQRPSAFPRQQSMPDQSQATALVPSSAPTVLNVGGGAGGGSSPISYASPSQAMGLASASSSGLARAISMASIRLFGVPTGMSLKSATARRSLRLGLGVGGLFSSSPGNATEFQTGDAAEQNLLNLLQDYGRKSFVLSEFADAKLSLFYSDGPHQGNYYDSGRSSSTSSVNLITAGRTGIGTGSASHGANSTSLSSEVVAAEALVLYVKSLSFLQRGIDATKDYIEARSARYASPFTTGVEVNEVVQWLRAKFNDGYERANFARSKASEEMPESAQNVDKMIFDKALEIARGAALEELGSNRAVNDLSWNAEKCLLAYETASNMLMALLDPGEEVMELSESSVGTIEKFVKSIHKRMASLQRQSDGVALAS